MLQGNAHAELNRSQLRASKIQFRFIGKISGVFRGLWGLSPSLESEKNGSRLL